MKNETQADPLNEMMASAVYLQVSTISQALIFVTRSRGWSFTERPGLLLVTAFIIAQLVKEFAIPFHFGLLLHISKSSVSSLTYSEDFSTQNWELRF